MYTIPPRGGLVRSCATSRTGTGGLDNI